ncbi:hypothetical protein Tsubulata_028407 [Turnera subulata]|uniref:PPM-type phosphatase domain-containing protein n=1 Tax=Turnera subulata TaxID=218843 RepID=A0A9Q0FHY6_9ROSI|nr:hypothetical protein Tsubulata_028407 [Turnera subulata]
MGACCSKDPYHREGVVAETVEENNISRQPAVVDEGLDDDIIVADYGARMRLHGASKYISMYSQQGRKGVNQDAMTVWEEFIGDKDMTYCGVFDGHGPYGHKVARHIRDVLPSRLSYALKALPVNLKCCNNGGKNNPGDDKCLSSWESTVIKSFKEMDQELSCDASIDSFCSGCTAVNVVKKGDHLIIANLGDSRAVLCTRDQQNNLAPVQLTVDLKPNIASEAERIKNCKGRVFALEEEPEVFRIWMPEEDCPGLAMARAFGDFCLKEYGLTSVPQISYRKLTNEDEFVVLATDGVWDVLSNQEVIQIVASTRKRSMAAKVLVRYAVRAWRSKYPGSKIDDCAVVCLFLKNQSLLVRTNSDVSRLTANHTELTVASEVSRASLNHSEIAAVPRKPILVKNVENLELLDPNNTPDDVEETSTPPPLGLTRVTKSVRLPPANDFTRKKIEYEAVKA